MLHEIRVVKNITITLPDEVALRARIWAAEADASLSALDNGSGILLSEALQHGQTISGLHLLNPFHPDFQIR